jgi:hypothetical protein
MADAPKTNSARYMVGVLIVASIIVLTIKPAGLDVAKLAGVILAAVTVLPVFYWLTKRIRSGNPRQVLLTFVVGFFYKLIVLMAGIWLGLTVAGWEMTGYVSSCLAFVFAFQVCESLYFWAHREVLTKSENA